MFSKAVLTVKDLVMPTGLRQTQVFESRSHVKRCVTILTDRALKMYQNESPRFVRRMVNAYLLLQHERQRLSFIA